MVHHRGGGSIRCQVNLWSTDACGMTTISCCSEMMVVSQRGTSQFVAKKKILFSPEQSLTPGDTTHTGIWCKWPWRVQNVINQWDRQTDRCAEICGSIRLICIHLCLWHNERRAMCMQMGIWRHHGGFSVTSWGHDKTLLTSWGKQRREEESLIPRLPWRSSLQPHCLPDWFIKRLKTFSVMVSAHCTW